MAGRKGKVGNTKGPRGLKVQDVDFEDRLQAVVLTESFEDRFQPLTAVKPRCLLPLANTPLIEYTLEFLVTAGVREVFLVCSNHIDQIIEYIEGSKWNQPWSPFKITPIISPEARSIGDVMRDIDNRGIITGDFVLISGDVVTNVDFNKMWDFHKRMHAKDKDHIATMCLTTAASNYKTRSFTPAAFVLEKNTNRCIFYQKLQPFLAGEKSAVEIDLELLKDVDEFSIRNDLIDCRIDICTPHVPPIFQENFDYQNLREDFVKGVISSDILGKHIYVYLSNSYGARVDSWHAYDTITQDYVGRWCYPFVVDSNMQEDQTYSYESRHIYKERNVVLAQSCKIRKCTVVGTGTKIGSGTHIENSVIGRNCQIGDNITIKDSFIWDNTLIDNDSLVVHSIIASNVKIGRDVILNDGSIVGFDVIIDDGVEIPAGTRLSAKPIANMRRVQFDMSDDRGSTFEAANIDKQLQSANIVGLNGVGFVYESDLSEDEEDLSDRQGALNTLSSQMEDLYLSDDSISSVVKKSKKRRTFSSSSMATDREGESDLDDGEGEEDFKKEGIATAMRALENNHDIDTALLELNTLRMSMNVTYHEVRTVTVIALLRRVNHFIKTQTLGPKDAVVKIFTHWGQLFRRQAFDEEEYVDLMTIITDKILEEGFERPDLILFTALNTLYDTDILEEDVIYKWWDNASENPEYKEVKSLISKWIDWLRTAEEESPDSDEDDSEESE